MASRRKIMAMFLLVISFVLLRCSKQYQIEKLYNKYEELDVKAGAKFFTIEIALHHERYEFPRLASELEECYMLRIEQGKILTKLKRLISDSIEIENVCGGKVTLTPTVVDSIMDQYHRKISMLKYWLKIE